MTNKKKVRAGLMGEWVFTKLGVLEASTTGGVCLLLQKLSEREREGLESHVIILTELRIMFHSYCY